jgi:uracil-DNA glycosylase
VTVVGQAPGPNTDHREPLSGASGRRLAALCGVTLAEFLALFDRANLLDRWPGPKAKGDRFDASEARMAACQFTPRLRRRRTVLLGRAVARAFHLHGRPMFEWLDEVGDGALVALAPHPSGISRWWNEPANARRARRFWRALAREAARGPAAPPPPPAS